MDLLVGILSPRLPVKLSDVVNDVLDAADDYLAARIGQVHHIIKGSEDVLLEHLLISDAD